MQTLAGPLSVFCGDPREGLPPYPSRTGNGPKLKDQESDRRFQCPWLHLPELCFGFFDPVFTSKLVV